MAGFGKSNHSESSAVRIARRPWLGNILLAGAYFASGKLSLLLAIPPGYATAVWPPAGLALAGLLLLGGRFWPGVWLGSFLVNASLSSGGSGSGSFTRSILLAAGIGLGAAGEALAGALLIKRFAGVANSLRRPRDVLRFLVLGGPVACLINATCGVTLLWSTGAIPGASFAYNWCTWWVGDTIGVLILSPLILLWFADDLNSSGKRRWTVTLSIAGTFACAVLIFVYASRSELASLRRDVSDDATQLVSEIEKQLDKDLELLHTMAAIFGGRRDISLGEFQQMAAPALKRHPGLVGIAWVPRVPAEQRSALEARARREGLEGFRISDGGGRAIEAGPHPDCFPILYLEPMPKNLLALGYNLADEPIRNRALERARDTGLAAMAGPVRLVQDSPGPKSFVLYVPVYGNSPQDVIERREQLRGFTGAAFRAEDFVNEAMRGLGRKRALEMRVYDKSAGQPAGPAIFSPPEGLGSGSAPGGRKLLGLQHTALMSVAGHQWELQFVPTLEYLAAHNTWQTWLVLAAGLLFTALVGAGLLILTGRTDELAAAIASFENEITRRLDIELALRESEGLLRLVIDNVPHGIFAKDSDGRFLFVNRAIAELNQLPPEQMVGRTDAALVADQMQAEAFRKDDLEVIHSGKPKYIDNEVLTDAAGEARILQTTKVPFTDPRTGHAAILGVAVDITGMKRAEKALREFNAELERQVKNRTAKLQESEARFRTAVEYSAIGFALVALDGRWLQVNRALCEIVGYDPQELLVRTFQDITHPDDLETDLSNVRDLLAGRTTHYHMEKRYYHKYGDLVWVLLSVSLVRSDKEEPLYFVSQIQDITQRKAAVAKQEELLAELQAANAEMERFTYTVSHDLKSPLITIQSFLGLLERDLAAGNRSQAENDLMRIGRAARRMHAMLEELLKLSRIGRVVHEMEPVSFGDIVQEALELVAGRIMNQNVRVVTQENWPTVNADRRRMVEVLQNLVDNAAKFMDSQREPTIIVGTEFAANETRFFVRDNGLGIDPRHHQKIFGLFDKLDPKTEGTGLGLAMVKRIIEMHGGRIWVESEGLGKGSTFWFTLARAVAESNLKGSL